MTVNSDEFSLIKRYFAPLSADAAGADGLNDDVASLEVSPGCKPLVTLDTIVAGVHFFPDDPARSIARKLLRVNLSDIAASGGVPVGYFLSLSLPVTTEESWIADFADGLRADQETYGISLYGGDTTRTSGPVSLSITAFGEAPEGTVIRRSGARAGDDIYLTGTIGAAATGLALIHELGIDSAIEKAPEAVARYREPQPRVAAGPLLRGRAGAAIDVSDGLAADAGHICAASAVGMEIDFAALPVSSETRQLIDENPAFATLVVNGGDDYEILFCASSGSEELVRECRDAGIEVTRIGRVVSGGAGVRIIGAAGAVMEVPEPGWRHFR